MVLFCFREDCFFKINLKFFIIINIFQKSEQASYREGFFVSPSSEIIILWLYLRKSVFHPMFFLFLNQHGIEVVVFVVTE